MAGMNLFASPFEAYAANAQMSRPDNPFGATLLENPTAAGFAAGQQVQRRKVADQLVQMGLTPEDDAFYSEGARLLMGIGDVAGANLLATQGRQIMQQQFENQVQLGNLSVAEQNALTARDKLAIDERQAAVAERNATTNLMKLDIEDRKVAVQEEQAQLARDQFEKPQNLMVPMTMNEARQEQGLEPLEGPLANMAAVGEYDQNNRLVGVTLKNPVTNSTTNISVQGQKENDRAWLADYERFQDSMPAKISVLDTASRAIGLLESQRIISGPPRENVQFFFRMGESLGISSERTRELLANTQDSTTMLNQLVLATLSTGALGTGTGISDKDREFLKDTVGNGDATQLEILSALRRVFGSTYRDASLSRDNMLASASAFADTKEIEGQRLQAISVLSDRFDAFQNLYLDIESSGQPGAPVPSEYAGPLAAQQGRRRASYNELKATKK